MLDFEYQKSRKERPFDIPNKLLLGAGPSNCSLRALRAMSLPALSPVSAETYQMMNEIQECMKYVFQTKNKLTMVHQVSGTGGLETVLWNLVEPGEKVLIAVGGVWGERTAEKARRAKMDVVTLITRTGEVFAFDELEKQIIKHKPVLLFITHSESSGGVLQPLEGLGDICHKYNCLLAVDAVISLGSDPLFVDRWSIDVAVAATQKALSAPAGMSLLTFSPRAQERIYSRKSETPKYYDVKEIADYWNCLGNPRKYVYTYNTNVLAAIRESLMQIAEEGLENVWKRHKMCSEKFLVGLEKLGIKHFISKVENRTNSLTPVVLPEDIEWTALWEYMNEKYLVELGFGIGPTLGTVRIGLMGVNAREEVVDYLLQILKESLHFLRKNEYKVAPRSEILGTKINHSVSK